MNTDFQTRNKLAGCPSSPQPSPPGEEERGGPRRKIRDLSWQIQSWAGAARAERRALPWEKAAGKVLVIKVR